MHSRHRRTLGRGGRRFAATAHKARRSRALRAGSKRKRVVVVEAPTKKMKQKHLKIKLKSVGQITQHETEEFDRLIKSSFHNSSINYVDKINDCVFVSTGTQVIAVMFLRSTRIGPNGVIDEHGRYSPGTSTSTDDSGYDDDTNATNGTISNSNNKKTRDSSPLDDDDKCIYIHTVCVSGAHRGNGLLHKMLYFVSTLPRFRHARFKLYASNTVEHANGLDQAVRFQIYSKSGFTLPVGTVIEPGGDTVVGVATQGQSRWTREHRTIVYTLRSRDGKDRLVSFRDIRPDACYMNSIKQERGCLMESDYEKLRDFNHKHDDHIIK
jgi:hypothetical protein